MMQTEPAAPDAPSGPPPDITERPLVGVEALLESPDLAPPPVGPGRPLPEIGAPQPGPDPLAVHGAPLVGDRATRPVQRQAAAPVPPGLPRLHTMGDQRPAPAPAPASFSRPLLGRPLTVAREHVASRPEAPAPATGWSPDPAPAAPATPVWPAQAATRPVQRAAALVPLTARPVSRSVAGQPSAPQATAGRVPADLPLATAPADPGAAAIQAGVATRAPNGAVVFREPAPDAAPDPTPAGPVPASAPAAAATATAAPAPPAAPTADLDDLARKLYDRLRARLGTELRLDRERAGWVTDLQR